MRATTGSGAGPPNMPECIALPSALSVMSTLVMPRSVVVSVGTPTAKLPVSTTRIVSARRRSAFSGTNASRPPVPCSSLPSQMILTPHGNPPSTFAQRAQRREVHDDVALAVGRPAPEPAPVALGQLPHRARPGVVAERRLHVVVRVEQHGRRARRTGRVAVHCLAAVRRRRGRDVLETDLRERVDHPLRGLVALLGRVLLGVGDRLEADELCEVVLRAAHEPSDGVAKLHGGSFHEAGAGSVGIVCVVDAAAAARSIARLRMRRWPASSLTSATPAAAQIAIVSDAAASPAASASAADSPASW